MKRKDLYLGNEIFLERAYKGTADDKGKAVKWASIKQIKTETVYIRSNECS